MDCKCQTLQQEIDALRGQVSQLEHAFDRHVKNSTVRKSEHRARKDFTRIRIEQRRRIGQELQAIRAAHDLKQSDVARMLDVSQAQLCMAESGVRNGRRLLQSLRAHLKPRVKAADGRTVFTKHKSGSEQRKARKARALAAEVEARGH